MSEIDQERILGCLRWTLQALAMPADVQISLYPVWVVTADELALDFENWRQTALANFPDRFSQQQKSSLESIDQILERHSGKESAFWEREGLRTHPDWKTIRSNSEMALKLFGWPIERPVGQISTYVRAQTGTPTSSGFWEALSRWFRHKSD